MKEANLHDIVNEEVVSKEENQISLEFVIPASSDFFDGHFPEYKLLPAVAQFEVGTRYSKKYFGTQRWVPSIKRIKFHYAISLIVIVMFSFLLKASSSKGYNLL